MTPLQKIREQKKTLTGEMRVLDKLLSDEKRGATETEQTRWNEMTSELGKLDSAEERAECLADREAEFARSEFGSGDGNGGNTGNVEDRSGRVRGSDGGDPTEQEFRNLGEFGRAVMNTAMPNRLSDPRLAPMDASGETRAATTYGNTIVGADGGWAVPEAMQANIVEAVFGEDSLASFCDRQPITVGNSTKIVKDETTAWDTSNGIQSYWEGEGATLTQSKPQLKSGALEANKLTVLIPVTEELLNDAVALGSYLARKAMQKMMFKVNLAIIQGSGVGQPLGILNAPALISIAKVGSQVADTIVSLNIIKMWTRMLAQSRRGAMWLINQDIEEQLMTLSKVGKLDTGANDTGWGHILPLYTWPTAADPFGRLMGRTVFPTQACNTLGDKGDIILAGMKDYALVEKAGMRAETSIHLWFDQDMTAFRFIMRIGGQPWLDSAVASRAGSNSLSPFVTLDERA